MYFCCPIYIALFAKLETFNRQSVEFNRRLLDPLVDDMRHYSRISAFDGEESTWGSRKSWSAKTSFSRRATSTFDCDTFNKHHDTSPISIKMLAVQSTIDTDIQAKRNNMISKLITFGITEAKAKENSSISSGEKIHLKLAVMPKNVTAMLSFASRIPCQSLRVRGRWHTPKVSYPESSPAWGGMQERHSSHGHRDDGSRISMPWLSRRKVQVLRLHIASVELQTLV